MSKGTIRSKPRNFGDFLCYPHSAYVQYASIVCLEKPRNSCGWSLRVGKVKILAPFRHLNDAYRDVRGVKVTKKGLKSTLHRPCCPLDTDANGFVGIYSHSAWFGSLSAYYLLMSVMRIGAVRQEQKIFKISEESDRMKKEVAIYRRNSLFFILMPVCPCLRSRPLCLLLLPMGRKTL